MSSPDVLVIGGGVVGAACAAVLAEAGLRVTLLEAAGLGGGATAAGMGHLVALDGDSTELELTRYSLERWRFLAPELGAELAHDPCGTLWLAEDEAQWALAQQRRERFLAHGVAAELLEGMALREAEPCLSPALRGGLWIPGDSVLYPPAAARLLARRAERFGAQVRLATPVAALEGRVLRLTGGARLEAAQVVLAAGCDTPRLLPGAPIVKRKGHLIISERWPGLLRHQLVELGYLASAHGSGRDSVAFNLQPRVTGQVLLGSSRQLGDDTPDLRAPLLARMVDRALAFVPALAEVPALRAWTGFRPTTPDHRPLIGPVPGQAGLWMAAGHEGLGITTAIATADLLAAQLLGRAPPIDPAPYLPARFPRLADA